MENKPLPLTVAREKFRTELENLVNATIESGVPAFVMFDAVCDLSRELRRLTDQQYRRDLAQVDVEDK